MEIATIINVHENPEQVRDVIDSVRAWATRNIILIVDKISWDLFDDFEHPDTIVVCGQKHGVSRGPYKNMSIGFKEAYKRWPNVQWYNYIEFDVLYLNSRFKEDLERGRQKGASLLGFNHNHQNTNNHWLAVKILKDDPHLVKLLGEDFPINCNKMLGAVQFYSNHVIKNLMEVNFFDKVLELTKNYKPGFFPDFNEIAVEELLFPSAAGVFGPVLNLSRCDGRGSRYTVRWSPPIAPHELTPETSIIHPLKDADSVIHDHYRKVRKLFLDN